MTELKRACVHCRRKFSGEFDVARVAVSHGDETKLWSTDDEVCRRCAWVAVRKAAEKRIAEFQVDKR